MELNNKNILFLLCCFTTIVCSCTSNTQQTNDMKKQINAYVVDNSNSWVNSSKVDTVNTKLQKFQFLNNPYKFGSEKNNMLIYFDDKLIYKGKYFSVIDVFVPIQFLGKRLSPTIQIFEGVTEYNFIQKSSILFSSNSKYLYSVFCPDNDLTGSCYLFSQDDGIF